MGPGGRGRRLHTSLLCADAVCALLPHGGAREGRSTTPHRSVMLGRRLHFSARGSEHGDEGSRGQPIRFPTPRARGNMGIVCSKTGRSSSDHDVNAPRLLLIKNYQAWSPHRIRYWTQGKRRSRCNRGCVASGLLLNILINTWICTFLFSLFQASASPRSLGPGFRNLGRVQP